MPASAASGSASRGAPSSPHSPRSPTSLSFPTMEQQVLSTTRETRLELFFARGRLVSTFITLLRAGTATPLEPRLFGSGCRPLVAHLFHVLTAVLVVASRAGQHACLDCRRLKLLFGDLPLPGAINGFPTQVVRHSEIPVQIAVSYRVESDTGVIIALAASGLEVLSLKSPISNFRHHEVAAFALA